MTSYIREDIYADEYGDTYPQRVHAAHVSDRSPVHVGYRAACGWCWLGYPHTQDAHAQRMAGGAA